MTGTQREIPGFPYYGTIDATPPFLIVLRVPRSRDHPAAISGISPDGRLLR
jgi:hypothetical protein